MTYRLVDTDCWGPCPIPGLPEGHSAFRCYLCGGPVYIMPCDSSFDESPCAAALPVHTCCLNEASAAVAEAALERCARQRAWEIRSRLN